MSENNPDHAIELLRQVYIALLEYLDIVIRNLSLRDQSLFPEMVNMLAAAQYNQAFGKMAAEQNAKVQKALTEYKAFCYAHNLPEKVFKFPEGGIQDREDMIKWSVHIFKDALLQFKDPVKMSPKGWSSVIAQKQRSITKDLDGQFKQFALEYRNSQAEKNWWEKAKAKFRKYAWVRDWFIAFATLAGIIYSFFFE